MHSCLSSVVDAIRPEGSPGCLGHRRGLSWCGPLTCGFAVVGPSWPGAVLRGPGSLRCSARPVVTAPAVIRRDGTVLADGWLPDFVRLGELERRLGNGVIEAIVDAALEERPAQKTAAAAGSCRIRWSSG